MIKILVIDDDRMNCELIQSVFTRHGYQVLSATSGIEGAVSEARDWFRSRFHRREG